MLSHCNSSYSENDGNQLTYIIDIRFDVQVSAMLIPFFICFFLFSKISLNLILKFEYYSTSSQMTVIIRFECRPGDLDEFAHSLVTKSIHYYIERGRNWLRFSKQAFQNVKINFLNMQKRYFQFK